MKKLTALLATTALISTSLLATGAFGQYDQNDDSRPIVAYDFENVSDGIVSDASGYGRDAKLFGDGARVGRGKTGSGLVLNETASDGYVRLPDGILSNASDVTIAVWLNLSNYVSYERVFDFGLNERFNFYMTPTTSDGSGNMQFAITDDSTPGEQKISVPTQINLNEWTRIAAVKRGETLELYLNGRLVAKRLGATLDVGKTLGVDDANYLGKSQYAHDGNLRETLDDFVLYDRALTPEEILRDAASTGGYVAVEPIETTVALGDVPQLPETTIVVDADGNKIRSAVVWNSNVFSPIYATDRYEIEGQIGVDNLKARAIVDVVSDSERPDVAIRTVGRCQWNDAKRIFARFVVAPRGEASLEAELVASLGDSSGTPARELVRQKISVGNSERVDKTFDLRVEDVEPGKSTVRLSVECVDGTLLAKPFVFSPRAIKSGSFLEDENVSLLDGPFKKARDDNARNLLQLDIDRLCAGHRLAAGLPEEAKRYGGWESWDSCGFGIGHWLSAACLMYRKTGDETYAIKIRHAVDELAQTQRPSGFIGGISEDAVVANIFDRPDAFQVNSYQLGGIWDCWYGVQKVYKGLVEVYQTFGDSRALELARGFGDWAKTQTDKFNHAQTQRMLTCEHGAVSETSLWLYEITNDSNYLELAKRFLRDDLLDPLSEGRDNLTGRHVNEQIPEIQNAATFYEFTGDEKYRRAAEFFWKTCRENRMYANSGMGLAEHYPAIDKEPLASSNTETCCNYNMMKLTETLFSWKRCSQYADYLEESLFNLIYPSQDQDNSEGYGKTYFTSFIPGSYRFFSTRDDSFWCCCLSGMESPARLDKSIYYKDGDALYVNLFVPSTARWAETGLSLKQETRFPYESSSKITITSGEANCAIRIRAPQWLASEMVVKINGELFNSIQTEEGYVEIRRLWQEGDVLEIETPMELNVYRSREGAIAFKYGPILLAAVLDEVDDAERYTTNNNKLGGFKGIEVPELTLDVDRPGDYIQSIDQNRLDFLLGSNATSDGSSFILRPFFELNRNRYIVYWNLKAK